MTKWIDFLGFIKQRIVIIGLYSSRIYGLRIRRLGFCQCSLSGALGLSLTDFLLERAKKMERAIFVRVYYIWTLKTVSVWIVVKFRFTEYPSWIFLSHFSNLCKNWFGRKKVCGKTHSGFIFLFFVGLGVSILYVYLIFSLLYIYFCENVRYENFFQL